MDGQLIDRKLLGCFQSIGVTKDWRLAEKVRERLAEMKEFPINRRHQGLATINDINNAHSFAEEFPINRRHQGLATLDRGFIYAGNWTLEFPINRRHQGLATALYGVHAPPRRQRVSNQ